LIDESLEIPDKVRNLQNQAVSKGEEGAGIPLLSALRQNIPGRCSAARVAGESQSRRSGCGRSFGDIESEGVTEWLNGLGKELHDNTYQPQPVRRVMIPKPGGGERALGIPTIRDRVAQTAAKLILEPIFEADLEPGVYGYRPDRSGSVCLLQQHNLATKNPRALRFHPLSLRWPTASNFGIQVEWRAPSRPMPGAPRERAGKISSIVRRAGHFCIILPSPPSSFDKWWIDYNQSALKSNLDGIVMRA
jgi:hypothetical protein